MTDQEAGGDAECLHARNLVVMKHRAVLDPRQHVTVARFYPGIVPGRRQRIPRMTRRSMGIIRIVCLGMYGRLVLQPTQAVLPKVSRPPSARIRLA
jgi:hypothetical protein